LFRPSPLSNYCKLGPLPLTDLLPHTPLFRSQHAQGRLHQRMLVRHVAPGIGADITPRRLAHQQQAESERLGESRREERVEIRRRDRKSTRLNSSHVKISYAVFCLKKKKTFWQ